jgi:exodeoxyribonuclease-3
MLSVVTWNVNSLRVRLPHLTQWLAQVSPDVVLLQETKTQDEAFPAAVLTELGYHCAFCGEKTYNGVAILSKEVAQDICVDFDTFPSFPVRQKRILAVTYRGIRIVNVYVPNGEAVGTEKYSYKLSWLAALRVWLINQLAMYPKLIVAGDFNIAPEDRDVHDPQAWRDAVLCSPAERAALNALTECGLRDSLRHVTQDSGLYSWWDYRMAAFRRNLGLRIDLILVSEALLPSLRTSTIDTSVRSWERPSDHAPVCAQFDN